jgi:peroxiredoxin Q/BCP
MLKEGDKAPDFTLQGPAGKVTLSSLIGGKGRYVVLYFYPRDNTPGCTREGQAFSAARAAFQKAGAVVYGISKDSVASHGSFAESCGISVPLLSDPDLAVHKAYGAYGEKKSYGKTTVGTIRSTFVVGPDGKLARVFPSVKVDGHAEKVLETVTRHADPAAPMIGKTLVMTKALKKKLGTGKKSAR